MAKKKETEFDYSFGFKDTPFYQEQLQKTMALLKKFPELSLVESLRHLVLCSGTERQNANVEGVLSKKKVKEVLDEKKVDTTKAPTIDQLSTIEQPIISTKTMSFKMLEFNPLGETPKIPILYDEKFNRVSGGPSYDKYVKDCQASYLVQSAMLAKMIEENGVDFIKTLPPKVIANQRAFIKNTFFDKCDRKMQALKSKEEVYTGRDEIIKKDDGTEEVIHHKGKLEVNKEHFISANKEYARLKELLKNPNNTPEQNLKIREAMKVQLEAKKTINADLRTLNKELDQVKEESESLIKQQGKEASALDKHLNKRAVKKADKILKSETKETVSLKQKISDLKMNLKSEVEDIRSENDGQFIRPVVKAAGKELISGISESFGKIVSAVKGKFTAKNKESEIIQNEDFVGWDNLLDTEGQNSQDNSKEDKFNVPVEESAQKNEGEEGKEGELVTQTTGGCSPEELELFIKIEKMSQEQMQNPEG